jgi:hypothetical protein
LDEGDGEGEGLNSATTHLVFTRERDDLLHLNESLIPLIRETCRIGTISKYLNDLRRTLEIYHNLDVRVEERGIKGHRRITGLSTTPRESDRHISPELSGIREGINANGLEESITGELHKVLRLRLRAGSADGLEHKLFSRPLEERRISDTHLDIVDSIETPRLREGTSIISSSNLIRELDSEHYIEDTSLRGYKDGR